MSFKFEQLEIWQRALAYCDLCYVIAEQLPKSEDFNLASQIKRAATSIALNIAEGSTGQTNTEQTRFLGLAVRSVIETVACQRLIQRRFLTVESHLLERADTEAQTLARQIHAMRRSLDPDKKWLREDGTHYGFDLDSEDTL